MKLTRTVRPADISVVIQGPLYRNLDPAHGIDACLASVRRHLPGAEIIISTWKGENVEGLEADQIIQSEDPGFMEDWSGNQINTNRMIRSTAAGIKCATRPYVLKFRADFLLTGDSLAHVGQLDDEASSGPRLFDSPITLTNLFIRNPLRMPALFHISDLVSFGTRQDMLTLWDHPNFTYEELFTPCPNTNPFGNFMGYSNIRLIPEQALMLATLRKVGIHISLRHPCQISRAHLRLWDETLILNFRVIDWQSSAISFPERFSSIYLDTLYSIDEIHSLAGMSVAQQSRRLNKLLLNKYVLCYFKPSWWISFCSITLFTLSPNLARWVRTRWRRVNKLQHPDSGRI